MPSATSSCSSRSAAASSACSISGAGRRQDLLPGAGQHLLWTFGSVFFQFPLGLILALLLNRPFPGKGAIAGAGVPALGGAELPDRPQLRLAAQPGRRPDPALAGRARDLRCAEQHPGLSRHRDVGADPRQRLVRHPVLRDHAAGGAAVDPRGHLRGGRDRRRVAAAGVLDADAAAARAGDRHHRAAAHHLDRQLRRPDRGDDQRRTRRHHPDGRHLHLHPGVPPARLRLRLGDRRGAAPAAARLFGLHPLPAPAPAGLAEPDMARRHSHSPSGLLAALPDARPVPSSSRSSRSTGWSRSRSRRPRCSIPRACGCGRPRPPRQLRLRADRERLPASSSATR